MTSYCRNGEVVVFDSKYEGELHPSLTCQLALLHTEQWLIQKRMVKKTLCVDVPNVQQQNGIDHCGLFSVAFAIHATSHGDHNIVNLEFD